MYVPACASCDGSHSHAHSHSSAAAEASRTSSLWTATIEGDLSRVEKIVERGVDVDSRDEAGYPAIVYAARHNQLDILLYLIRKGANCNLQIPETKATALHRAAAAGHVRIVRALVEVGRCDRTIADYQGSTALQRYLKACSEEAIINKSDEIVALLTSSS